MSRERGVRRNELSEIARLQRAHRHMREFVSTKKGLLAESVPEQWRVRGPAVLAVQMRVSAGFWRSILHTGRHVQQCRVRR